MKRSSLKAFSMFMLDISELTLREDVTKSLCDERDTYDDFYYIQKFSVDGKQGSNGNFPKQTDDLWRERKLLSNAICTKFAFPFCCLLAQKVRHHVRSLIYHHGDCKFEKNKIKIKQNKNKKN